MADVKAAGFSQVLFRFFPQGAISPPDPNYDYSLVNEHFNLIQAVRPALVKSGVPYLIDLSVEAAPRDSELPLVSNPWKYPDKPNWSMGVRALWQNYFKTYGSADTICVRAYGICATCSKEITRVPMRWISMDLPSTATLRRTRP
jgi:hypothetical protein